MRPTAVPRSLSGNLLLWVCSVALLAPSLVSAIAGNSGQLLNISTRLKVQSGENALIGGFIIAGANPKKVIVRALGPSLASSGVTGVLADPTLELHDGSGATIATNDNWKETQSSEVTATGIPPANDLESAIVRTLAPGNYTAIVRGKDNGSGIALVEVYDLEPANGSVLANISTRGVVEGGDSAMIGGVIVGPSGANVATVLLRALGSSLLQAGVQNALADPKLELHDGSGTVIATSNNWRDTQETEITATGIPPSNDREAAMLSWLAPGNYTAVVRGNGSSSGIALVEAYQLPPQDPRVLLATPRNILVNDPSLDTYPHFSQFEPSLGVFGSRVVVSWNDTARTDNYMSGFATAPAYAVSLDRGATFIERGALEPDGHDWGADTTIAVDRSGSFYMGRFAGEAGSASVDVYKSTDGGSTFHEASPMFGLNGTSDKPFLAVDTSGGPYNGKIYTTWTAATGALIIAFASSGDGGQSFSKPISLSSSGSDQQSMPAVGPNGELYVIWRVLDTNELFIRRSDDGGATFTPQQLVVRVHQLGKPTQCGRYEINCFNGDMRAVNEPILAVDTSHSPSRGNLYLVFTDLGAGSDMADVYITRSTDRGATWDAPRRLNDDAGASDQFRPFVTVAPNGVVAVTWNDRRLDSGNYLLDVFSAMSTDGGQTFGRNFRITDVSFPPMKTNPPVDSNTPLGCYAGSYNFMAADADDFYVAWTDTRFTTSGAPDPNIFFAKFAVPPYGYSASSPTPIIAVASTEIVPVTKDGTALPDERLLGAPVELPIEPERD